MQQKPVVETLFAWLKTVWPSIESVRVEDLLNIKEVAEFWIFRDFITRTRISLSKFQFEAFRHQGLGENALDVIAGHVKDFLIQARYEVLPAPQRLTEALSRSVPPASSFTAFYENNDFASVYFMAYLKESGTILVFSNILPVELTEKL